MKSSRIHFIDVAKAIAIFYIALGHALVHSQNSTIILQFVCSFHVVLFFVLSGYTFRINNEETFFNFFKNKFIRIMIPYFCWAILFLIPYMIFGKSVGQSLGTNQSFDLLNQIFNILYGNGNDAALKQNSSLWFLPALFTIEIFYYLVIKYTKGNIKKESWTIIILFCLGFISSKYLKIILPIGINTMLNVGIFFIIGYLLKERDLLKKINVFETIVLLLIGLVACYENKIHLSYIDFYYGNYIFMLLSGLCLSLFTLKIAERIGKNKVLEYIGKNTMGILIFHKIVIIIFQTKLGVISNLLYKSSCSIELFIAIISIIISFFVSLIGTEIIRKICPFLIGEKPKKITNKII